MENIVKIMSKSFSNITETNAYRVFLVVRAKKNKD
jgi:hypothetical protein